MNQSDVIELVHDRLLPAFDTEKTRLDRIDRWYRKDPEPIKLPRDATDEHKALLALARTPALGLVVTTVAQTLFLERVYSERTAADETSVLWKPWERNGMHARQIPLHRAALAYGLSYTLTLPGDTGAKITCHSPMSSMAFYGDVVEDEFPTYFLRVIPQSNGRVLRLVDEGSVHFLGIEPNSDTVEYIEERIHGTEYTPVVRYANQMDLEGDAPGEVDPLIPLAARINKTDYDRLLVQHYNSWKVRTATGLEKPATKEEGDRQKMLLRQNDILTGEEGVVFDTLDETPMDGFVKAHDSDFEALAAVSQTPVTAFGKMVNVSAEGLAEARAGLYAKRDERKVTFGQSHTQTLRVAASIEGRQEDANDFSLQCQWADTETRTISATVDALGKAAQMLGVPPQLLWDKIPGVDLTTAKAWREYAEEHPSEAQILAGALANQSDPTAV